MIDLDTIVQGDVLDVIAQMKRDGVRVNMCVTSPPYWGLRDYGVVGQIGLEPTIEEYVDKMVAVFRGVWEILAEDGTLWLNLGDSYAGGGGFSPNAPTTQESKSGRYGLSGGLKPGGISPKGIVKPKDLCGIPWRVAFALQADGWYLRQDIIWAKPNPMPESVTDRCTKSHEYVFLLSKNRKYFYDAEAVREPHVRMWDESAPNGSINCRSREAKGIVCNPSGRNKRSVWTIATESFSEAHFATFPQKLVEPCILAGTSQKGHCPKCGKGWARVVKKEQPPENLYTNATTTDDNLVHTGQRRNGVRRGSGQKVQDWRDENPSQTITWSPSCACALDPQPGIVLDPFMGSGTTALVAEKLGRNWIGIELNPEYIDLAEKRVSQESMLKAMGMSYGPTITYPPHDPERMEPGKPRRF